KTIATFHDAFDFPSVSSNQAALQMRLAADARLDSLGRRLSGLPTPHTRDQRYFFARLEAYHSAAAHWLEAQYEAAVVADERAARPASDDNGVLEMRAQEQLGTTVALNEQYDLLAAAEHELLKTSVLWDRLRVRRGPEQSVRPSELKRRMALADS